VAKEGPSSQQEVTRLKNIRWGLKVYTIPDMYSWAAGMIGVTEASTSAAARSSFPVR